MKIRAASLCDSAPFADTGRAGRLFGKQSLQATHRQHQPSWCSDSSNMAKSSDDEVMFRWAADQDLTEATLQVLKNEGFTNLRLLAGLTADDIKENFQMPKLLPLAQCIALRKATALLTKEDPPREVRPRTTQTPEHCEAMDESPDANQAASVVTARTITPARAERRAGKDSRPADRSGQVKQARAPAAPKSARTHPDNSAAKQTGAAKSGAGAMGVNRHPQKKQEPEEELRFLLVGKTGSGKSTTGNTILGEERFPTELAFGSVTSTCQLERRSRDGVTVEIMDSPGLFDTERSHENIATDIVKAVACMHPGPHAVLYVIRLSRYTEEEYDVYQRLKALFDDTLVRFMVVVFTGGDSLEGSEKSMADVLQSAPKELRHVLAECDNRYIVFNNMADNKGPQVQQLFRQVRQLTAHHGGRYYTCPKYAEVSEGVEQEVTRRLAEVDRRHADKTGYVQQLRQAAEAAQQGVDDERARFEERERERQQRMEEEQERARREMEKMMQEMTRQHADAKQQQEKERQLRVQLQEQMEEQRRAFERQATADRQKLQQRERELEELKNKEQEIQWNTEESLEEERREVLRTMKDRMARDEEERFVNRFKAEVMKIATQAKRFITQVVTRHSNTFV